jgi:tRNA threonylcarbamoyladenosine biosynthesis protein TsaB
MILLATDTSGKDGSVALARASDAREAGPPLEILEVVALEGGNFSAQLVPLISGLLAKHGLSKYDISGFAVATGPGSFTGLRVGLAVVKGLAEALEKPIAAVSRLEAIARAYASPGDATPGGCAPRSVVAVLDAGRRQAFVGEYDLAADSAICLKEHLLLWEELAACAAGRIIVTPDEAVAEALRSTGASVRKTESTRADAIARIGWRKLLDSQTSDVAAQEANYIRRTDAEILIYGK